MLKGLGQQCCVRLQGASGLVRGLIGRKYHVRSDVSRSLYYPWEKNEPIIRSLSLQYLKLNMIFGVEWTTSSNNTRTQTRQQSHITECIYCVSSDLLNTRRHIICPWIIISRPTLLTLCIFQGWTLGLNTESSRTIWAWCTWCTIIVL